LVEKRHSFTPCPAGDTCFPFRITSLTGLWLTEKFPFYQYVVPDGTETTFFKPDFSKNEYYIFHTHLRK